MAAAPVVWCLRRSVRLSRHLVKQLARDPVAAFSSYAIGPLQPVRGPDSERIKTPREPKRAGVVAPWVSCFQGAPRLQSMLLHTVLQEALNWPVANRPWQHSQITQLVAACVGVYC